MAFEYDKNFLNERLSRNESLRLFFEYLAEYVDGQYLNGAAVRDYEDGVCEIESDTFVLHFKLQGNELSIHNIEVHKNWQGGGIGSQVIESLKLFAEENSLVLKAKDVKSEAEGFWRRMDFCEGEDGDFYCDI